MALVEVGEQPGVSEIAERAGGLSKMTFFRHFPDKREVLLAAGQEVHSQILAARLRTVIAAHSELRERAAFKHLGLAAAMAGALEQRGVPELTASLAAELGLRAFDRAFARWADPAGSQTLTDLTRQALGELRDAAATLG